jgi:hypothetical protein
MWGGINYSMKDLDAHPDNDFYILDYDLREWQKVQLMGEYPAPRSLHSFCFFSETQFVIMGGITTEKSEGLDRPKVYSDFHMCDIKEKFFGSPFTANIRPTARYGHAVASNLEFNMTEEHKQKLMDGPFEPELIIIGGMDF